MHSQFTRMWAPWRVTWSLFTDAPQYPYWPCSVCAHWKWSQSFKRNSSPLSIVTPHGEQRSGRSTGCWDSEADLCGGSPLGCGVGFHRHTGVSQAQTCSTLALKIPVWNRELFFRIKGHCSFHTFNYLMNIYIKKKKQLRNQAQRALIVRQRMDTWIISNASQMESSQETESSEFRVLILNTDASTNPSSFFFF